MISLSHKQISGGDEEVECITIDDFIASNKIDKVDFIKMDIEGEEMNAIMGGKKCISQFTPKLAICTYHIPEHMHTLFDLINSIDVDYKYYFFHASNVLYDSILYCQPQDKIKDKPLHHAYNLSNTDRIMIGLLHKMGGILPLEADEHQLTTFKINSSQGDKFHSTNQSTLKNIIKDHLKNTPAYPMLSSIYHAAQKIGKR